MVYEKENESVKHIGLTEKELSQLISVFVGNREIVKVVLFGSRAKGVARPNSDVDLAITGICNSLQIEALAQELDSLPLPYQFDIQAVEKIRNPALLNHINRVGVEIYSSS